jgi:hypothetical protein
LLPENDLIPKPVDLILHQKESRLNVTRSQAIKAFLTERTIPDLASLYGIEMECQVNVAQDAGDRIEGDYHGRQWHGWTDGIQVWKSFRIPYNASSNPEYDDRIQSYDLAAHAEGIGMTGWDWKNRLSRWVAFDFDAITGHSDKNPNKLTKEQLQEIQDVAFSIPWITVRRSTSGKGLHLYVFLTPVQTANHNEHSALARSILGLMSATANFDFTSRVDVCGGNMWIWHRKMKGTNGLEIIKSGSILQEVPSNWRDHVPVISGKRRKILPSFVADSESKFEEIAGQRSRVKLDAEHQALIKFLDESGASFWWDTDNYMLVAHTWDLMQAHENLKMRGVFKTVSTGREHGHDHNCFSGETEVLTFTGVYKIKDLAKISHAPLYVLTNTGMQWIDCEIKSFGVQKTVKIDFGNHSSVNATQMHEWLYLDSKGKIKQDRKYTCELFLLNHQSLPLAQVELPEIDYKGYAHGFVYGDGWQTKRQGCSVAFFKNDEDLISIVGHHASSISRQSYDGCTYVPVAIGLPNDWKELPENCTKAYALGFILGLISADGFVTSHSQIFQSNPFELEKIRKLAIYAGLRARNIRLYGNPSSLSNAKQPYALTIDNYNLTVDHFIRKDHKIKFKISSRKGVYVKSVGNIETIEEVFCAIVPRYHNFTLGNGVITGNCYLFPQRRGAWVVRRFTPGITEDGSWDQDANGWTRCYLNQEPDLRVAARSNNGIEDDGNKFVFRYASDAQATTLALGANVNVPAKYQGRKTVIKPHKDGKRLVIELEREAHDSQDDLKDWLPVTGNKWRKIITTQKAATTEPDVDNYDDLIRHLVTTDSADCGWVIKSDDSWHEEPLAHVKTALESLGIKTNEIKSIIGGCVFKPWKLVNRPFQSEYPGDREWNRNAAQFRFVPSTDSQIYPTWLRILNHVGNNLDEAVESNAWCQANGLLTGADYLKCWIASLFQHPEEPLPYLFLYGPQASGKSIFHEALNLLVTTGCVRADHALTSSSGFNGELENAILCVIEETDLKHNKHAYNKIKDWVTSISLPIRKLFTNLYSVRNTTHWVQASNDRAACPVFPGDTRITMVFVDALTEQIAKREIFILLEKEAPDFLAEILRLELPRSNDRLNIPILETTDKITATQANQTLLEVFLEEQCYQVDGESIQFSEFYDTFVKWLEPNDRYDWTKIKVGRAMPSKFPKGRNPANAQWMFGNISFSDIQPTKPRLVLKGDKLNHEI